MKSAIDKPTTKSQKFETIIRNLEEMAKIGQVGSTTITIDDPELVDQTHVGDYYKIKTSDISGTFPNLFKSSFYEKKYKFKFREIMIQIHLYTELSPKEAKEFQKAKEDHKKTSENFRKKFGLVGESLPF